MNLKSKAIHHHLLQHAKARIPIPGSAQLTYYIFEGLLVGICGREQVLTPAWSGGGGGAKRLRPTENANNPYMYGLKAVEDKHKKPLVRGGPIPPGSWRVYPPAPHKGFKRDVCVLEARFKLPNGRGDF